MPGSAVPFDYKDYGVSHYATHTTVNSLNEKVTKKRGVGKPPTVKPEAPNLVSTWRALVTRTDTLTEALTTLNTVLGMKITHSRITEWERDEKAPSTRIINYMLATVVPALLLEQGHKEKEVREIAAQVRIPGV